MNEPISRESRSHRSPVSKQVSAHTSRFPGFVSLHEINKVFDRLPEASKPDLSQTFAKHKQDSSWPPKRDRSGDYILAICEALSGLDQWGVSTREHFLMQQGEGSHAKWAVDWRTLGKAMKRSLIEAVVRDKLGEHAIRCWRILEAKGKLDEKHVCCARSLLIRFLSLC